MHNILRMFVTSVALLFEAKRDQIDKRGAEKAVATIWPLLTSLSTDVLQVTEELMDEPTRSIHDPHPNERKWLKAIIDELGSPSEQPILTSDDSWKTLTHGIAWFAFCLREAGSYAENPEYGKTGFERICGMIGSLDDDEKALIAAGITESTLRFDASEVRYSQITDAFDKLLSCTQT